MDAGLRSDRPEHPRTGRRLSRVAVSLVGMTGVLLAGWFGLFAFLPGLRHDPRSPRYLLWKYCALPMPKDAAFATAMRDPDRDRLVVGLTAAEVERKFGIALRRADDPDLTNHQQHYEGTGEYAWLGDSWFMVEFQGGRAVRCRLMKG